MSLFEGNRARSLGIAGAIAIGAWFIIGAIPNNLYALNLTQTSVALLALSALAIFVVAHHRAQATVVTRAQEEMMLIGTFGLVFFSILVVVKAFVGRGAGLQNEYALAPAAQQIAQAQATGQVNAPRPPTGRYGNRVHAGRGAREWEDPVNRWKDGYITEEWVYY